MHPDTRMVHIEAPAPGQTRDAPAGVGLRTPARIDPLSIAE